MSSAWQVMAASYAHTSFPQKTRFLPDVFRQHAVELQGAVPGEVMMLYLKYNFVLSTPAFATLTWKERRGP